MTCFAPVPFPYVAKIDFPQDRLPCCVFFATFFFIAPMNFLYMRRQSITEQQQRWFLDVWRKQLAFTLQTNYWPRLWRVGVEDEPWNWDDWIISNLAAVSLLGLRLSFSVTFGWNYRNRSRLKCRARLINAFAAVLHLFSDHKPEAVSTGKQGSAKSVKTESCSCTGLATGTSATAITPSIGVVHLP